MPPDPESERPSYLHSFLATACFDVKYDWPFPKHFRLWAPENKNYATYCASDVPGQTARQLPAKRHPRMLMIYPVQRLGARKCEGTSKPAAARCLSPGLGRPRRQIVQDNLKSPTPDGGPG